SIETLSASNRRVFASSFRFPDSGSDRLFFCSESPTSMIRLFATFVPCKANMLVGSAVPGAGGKPSERAQTEALQLVVEKLEFGVLRRGHVIAARESILRLGCGNTVDLCLHQIAYTRAAQPRRDRRVLFGYVLAGILDRAQ